MALREGHEFLRGHLGHSSARMSLSPDTKGAFLLGLPGAGHSFTSACRLMTHEASRPTWRASPSMAIPIPPGSWHNKCRRTRDFLLGLPSRGHRPQARSLHGSIIISFPLGPGRNEFGPAVVRVRTAK